MANNKYDRKIVGKDGTTTIVDVYRVLDAFNVTNPQLQHLIKKALAAGLRGHKSFEQDLKDILDSAQSAKVMYEQKHGLNKNKKGRLYKEIEKALNPVEDKHIFTDREVNSMYAWYDATKETATLNSNLKADTFFLAADVFRKIEKKLPDIKGLNNATD